VNDQWQLMYFDGITATQLTSQPDMPSVRADILDNNILYARSTGPDSWQIIEYAIDSATATDIYDGDSIHAWPHFREGNIHLTLDNDPANDYTPPPPPSSSSSPPPAQ
jgi:hypothetical protein